MSVQVLQHAGIVLLWALFGLLHSMLASERVKKKTAQWLGRYAVYYRPAYSVFALVQLVLILVYQFSVESRLLWRAPVALEVVFGLGAAAGLWIMAASIKKYFFHLSGIGVFYKKKEQVFLVMSGLHGRVRHPLYAGTLLCLGSLCMLFPFVSHWLAFATITLYTLIGIGLEEKKLEKVFGEQYRIYKKKVPMIIPFLKLPPFEPRRH